MNIPNQDNEAFECPICFQLMERPCTTTCGHNFCYDCIKTSIEQVPKCPICRYPLLQNARYLRENTLIKTLIMTKFPQHKRKEQNAHLETNINLNAQETQIGARVALYSLSNLFPCGKQKFLVDFTQFGGITFDGIKQFLQAAQVIVMSPNDKKQTSEIEKYGTAGSILGVQLQSDKIVVDFMAEDRVMVREVNRVQFKLVLQNQETHEQEIQPPVQDHEFQFEMLTCKAHTLNDDPININSEETKLQLQTILKNLIKFLNVSLKLNTHQLDTSTQIVQQALQKTGLFSFLTIESLQNQDQIRKLSLILGGVLRLPYKEKQRIFQTTDLIERLILLNEGIKRFQGIENQLMIYDLDLPSHGTTSITSNIMILVAVLVFLFLFNIPITEVESQQ